MTAAHDPNRIHARIGIDVPPARVFAAWADVAHWSRWDPDTRAATLDGPLRPGARGTLTPAEGRTVAMVVEAVERDRRLYVRCPVLGASMHFDHRVEPRGTGSTVVHEVWFTGWLAPLLRRMVGRPLRQRLPQTLASLRDHLEQSASSDRDRSAAP